MPLKDCNLIELPTIHDKSGNLTFIEEIRHVPFNFQRIYYLHNLPSHAIRGGHAHKQLHQFMIAISGSFDITLDDGDKQTKITLNQPNQGLYICPMIWRELSNFSINAVCMVLASALYDEQDYYRNYQDFIFAVKREQNA